MADTKNTIKRLQFYADGNGNRTLSSKVANEAIQIIRELQEQIPKCHLVADGDLPKDDTAVIAYIKREITDVFMMVNISSISGKWQMWESDRDLYDDEEVIAWMELPSFEKMEGETRC